MDQLNIEMVGKLLRNKTLWSVLLRKIVIIRVEIVTHYTTNHGFFFLQHVVGFFRLFFFSVRNTALFL